MGDYIKQFNTEYLYYLNISELGTIQENNIFYKGISLNKVDNQTLQINKVRDHENFITGKDSLKKSIITSVFLFDIFLKSIIFSKIKILKRRIFCRSHTF